MTRTKSASARLAGSPAKRPRSSIPTASASVAAKKAEPKTIEFANRRWKVNKLFHTFFEFVAERHRIFRKRLAGEDAPWTDDAILQQYPFTNVFRVLDRNTQYILRNVINQGKPDIDEAFFRVLLFRTFNKIETWEMLERALGPLTWANFNIEEYSEVLANAEGTLYGPAYIIPAPRLGYALNWENHLRLIEAMMEARVARELKELKHLKDAHGRLLLYPSMGEFTAMQLLLDVNMIPHYNWSEDEWVALGPGSSSCLKKMFGSDIGPHALDAIRYIRDQQYSWFAWRGIRAEDIPRLTGRAAGLSMVDIEHALCECEKYARGKHPEFTGGRTQVGKHNFAPRSSVVTADVPKHWRTVRALPTYKCNGPVLDDDVYEVSHIVRERNDGTRAGFLVRWTGWGLEEDSWLSRDELSSGSPALVRDWDKLKTRVGETLDARRIERAKAAAKVRAVRRPPRYSI